MPRWTACLVAAVLLTACDAGNTVPGSDNAWPGPELDIQVPGPRTTVAVTRDAAGVTPPANVFFRLRPLGEAGTLQVRFAVDDGPFRAVEDATVKTTTAPNLAPGTRLVSAYLVKNDGTPRFGARATSVSTFVLQVTDAASGAVLGRDANNPGTAQYGYQDEDRLWHPFDADMPCLVVDDQGTAIHVLAHRCALDGATHRVRFTIGKRLGTIAGADAGRGRFGATLPADPGAAVDIVLEAKGADGTWSRAPGSRSSWRRPTE